MIPPCCTARAVRIAGGVHSLGAYIYPLLAAALLCLSPMAAADVADGEAIVISHPGIGVDSLSRQTVRDLYLGKSVQLANGTRVELIDLPAGHPVREDFYVNIIGRDPGQMRAYWAKRIFTGKGRPPETLHDERAVVRWVAEESGRIAYVGAGAVDDSVRILYKQQHND